MSDPALRAFNYRKAHLIHARNARGNGQVLRSSEQEQIIDGGNLFELRQQVVPTFSHKNRDGAKNIWVKYPPW